MTENKVIHSYSEVHGPEYNPYGACIIEHTKNDKSQGHDGLTTE